MADKINFELVSPERLLLSTEAEMVVVPGAEGDFGVMAGHTPVISTIRPGIIEVHDGGEVTRLFVRGGFVEASQSGLTVLAEEAIALADVDLAALDQQLKDLQEDIQDARDSETRAQAQTAYEDIRQVRDAATA